LFQNPCKIGRPPEGGLEHLAIRAEDDSAILIKLAHIARVNFCKQCLGQILQAVRHVSAEDHVHQIAQRVRNAHKIARLSCLAIFIQLLLDEADAQRDCFLSQVCRWSAFHMRPEYCVELF